MSAGYTPSAGDLVWTDFDPTRGREQAGRRPALVISAAAFTAYTGLAVVCPITSRVRPFPTSVVLPTGLPVTGEILTSHVRSIDTLARPIRYAGAQAVAQEVRAKLETSSHSDCVAICRVAAG
jgi:mRNA interferase MazF